MNIDENKLKEELRDAIIDCGYIAQIVIDELPDLEQIEILEMALKSLITYSLGIIHLNDEPEKISLLRSEIVKSLDEFREYVEVSKYDKDKFIDETMDSILGNDWK